MRNMVFYIVFFVAYVSTTLNAKADFKQNLDSNATTCCVAYNEASQMNFGKKNSLLLLKMIRIQILIVGLLSNTKRVIQILKRSQIKMF